MTVLGLTLVLQYLKESNSSDIWVLLLVVICHGHPRFKLLSVEVRECWAQFTENITNSLIPPQC